MHVIKMRKLTLIQYWSPLKPRSKVKQKQKFLFWDLTKEPVSRWATCLSSHPQSSMTLTFSEECRLVSFWVFLTLGFLMTRFRLCIFGRVTTEVMLWLHGALLQCAHDTHLITDAKDLAPRSRSPEEALSSLVACFLAYEQQKFISHCSGGWESKIRVPTWSSSSEGPPPRHRRLLTSLCPHLLESRERTQLSCDS